MVDKLHKLSERSQMHMARKLWHLASGCGALFIYYSSDKSLVFWGWVSLAIALAGFAFDFFRLKNSQLNEAIISLLFPIMRKAERENYSGLPFYALGIGLTILFYQEHIALISIYFLIFADPIASYVGIKWGKDKILPHKSVQGSLAAFFTCYVITSFYLYEHGLNPMNLIIFTVIAALIGAVSELTSAFNIDDNFTIPVLSGAGLTLLHFFFNVF